MYVDYIKVYEWNGLGEVHLGPPDFESGTFGVYTDETPINNGLVAGVNAEIYVWEGTLSNGSIPSYEGENGISWMTTGAGWFGAGIMSVQPVNLFNFGEGNVKFMIKIPANVSFKIGVIDAWGNQNYVDFPANQTTYGLDRNGEWGQASIPVDDIRGEFIDLRMLSYEFVILEVTGASCVFGLDDIYWEGGVTGINDYHVTLPANGFIITNNYPNPFNSFTTIDYALPSEANIELTVIDITGRIVKTLVNESQNAGTYSVSWRAENVESGLYFVRMKAGGFTDIRKCMLQK
jgi:hypothetical protein